MKILKRRLTCLTYLAYLSIACLFSAAQAAGPTAGHADHDEAPEWSFVPGRYELIGRYPDSTRSYAGAARIERSGDKLRLVRNVAGKQSTVFGVVRRAEPGEANVLAFTWRERRPMEMVCVIGSDLDNYARLTCHWGIAGNPHRRPGIEAYFSREPWEPFKLSGPSKEKP